MPADRLAWALSFSESLTLLKRGVRVIHHHKSKHQLTGRVEARLEESAEMWHQHENHDKSN